MQNPRGRHHFCVNPDNDSSNWDFNLKEMSFRSQGGEHFIIVGCCNGLICLADGLIGKTNVVYLWNPCISRYIELPMPKVIFSNCGPYDGCLGFRFDERTNDYKVVRITYLECWDWDYSSEHPPFVEVYSITSGLWRFVDYDGSSPELRIYTRYMYSQCFLRGAVHWLALLISNWKAIMTFNVSVESFWEIKLPPSLEGSSVLEKLTLRTCWDMLALINKSNEKISIWVMKEYGVVDSWTKMCMFTCSDLLLSVESICFRTNKDILLCMQIPEFDWISAHLFCNDNEDNRGNVIRSVSIDGSRNCHLGTIPTALIGFHLSSYEESLALFKEGRPTSSYVSKYKGLDVSDDDVYIDEMDAEGLEANDLLS